MKKIIFFLFTALLILPASTFAKIGVGVGTGKIVVDEKLKPGIIYKLPSITVFNTGDVESEYSIATAYHEKQPELRPSKEWFTFTPHRFNLAPGESQEVKITLNLPLKTEPGKYFAYLEGFPINTGKDGSTTVGVAAATKLYFEIEPGSFIEGLYYRVLSIWNANKPWSERLAGILVAGVVILAARKYLKIEINLKNKRDE